MSLVSIDPVTEILTIYGGQPGVSSTFKGYEALVDMGNITGAVNIDLSAGSAFKFTLTGNVTLTPINVPAGSLVVYFTCLAKQDATGSRTLTITGQTNSFAQRAVLSTTANSLDKFACESWDVGSTWQTALTGQQIA